MLARAGGSHRTVQLARLLWLANSNHPENRPISVELQGYSSRQHAGGPEPVLVLKLQEFSTIGKAFITMVT